MFNKFEEEDFNLFAIEGLEARMDVLKTQLRPKFEQLGVALSEELSVITGDEMYSHVAKHARRKTNPPDDSWVAFASNQRGYKMMPHFQVTFWETHVLIQWGIIYEAKNKEKFAHNLSERLEEVISKLPGEFQWSKDHMKPEGKLHRDMTKEDFEEFVNRLLHSKKGEVMVGLPLTKEEVLEMSAEEFMNRAISVWKELNYLHKLAK